MFARRHVLWVHVLTAVAHLLLLESICFDKSDTYDEHLYVDLGSSQWSRGLIAMNALPLWGFGAAQAVAGLVLDPPEGPRLIDQRLGVRWEERLLAARQATIAVVVAAGLLLAGAARGRAGPLAGILLHLAWVLSPNILANGSLATLDPWAASMIAACVWAAERHHRDPSLRRLVVLAFLAACAASCKPTAGVVAPFALALALARAERGRRLGAVVLFGSVWLGSVWAIHAFDWGQVSGKGLTFGPVPMPTFVRQLLVQTVHGYIEGHRTHFDGRIRGSGTWRFYFVAIAYKTTLSIQLLGLVAIALRARARAFSRADAAILAYPAALFVAMSAGRTQLGLRYLLPAAPVALFWITTTLATELVSLPRLRPLVLGLAGASALAALVLIHPDELMFFNTWAGGPERGARVLVDGSDWCQDKRRLGRWQAERKLETFFYSGCGGDPKPWGIESQPAPCDPRPGTFAIHYAEAYNPFSNPRGCFRWLRREKPVEVLGRSIAIYHIDGKRAAELERRFSRKRRDPAFPSKE